MKTYKRTTNQIKILKAVEKIYDQLIKSKKKMNSKLVIIKEDKIISINP